MSNLRSTGHLPLKTSMTNKWKSQAPTSDLLEKQTRALEDSLNKLKIAMHPDKTKTTTEGNNSIWDKGKTGPLSQYANHVLRDEPRRVFDANKPTKIRVLGDEPLATVTRPSLVANLFSNKPTTTTTINKGIKCGQCEKDEAKMKCLECAESYCASCFAHFHLRGALQRHRCVSLSESRPATPQKKRPPVGADVIFKELCHAQSKDDLLRKSTITTDMYEYNDDDIEYEEKGGGQLLKGNYDEKNSAASFQQALLQWRQNDNKKKISKNNHFKKIKSTHEAAVDTVHDSNGKFNEILIPNIEFHSSKLTYAEKLLLKKYRRSNKNHEEFFNQRISIKNQTPREQFKKIENIISVNHSLPDNINFKNSNIDIETLYDDLPTVRAEDSARTITADENNFNNNNNFDQDDEDEELMRLKQEERSKSRSSIKPLSRPNSSAMRKNSTTSRPNSVALFQHPLPSLLSTNPSDELKAITDSQSIPSRPSSAALKKPSKLDYRLPTMWNRNWKPEQSVSNGIDMKSIKIDSQSVVQFDLALNDLLDETKIESASRSDNLIETNRSPPTPIFPISARSEKEKFINTPKPPTSTRSEKDKTIDTPRQSTTPRFEKETPINTPRQSTTPRLEKETPINTPKPPISARSEKDKTINTPRQSTTPRLEKEKFINTPKPPTSARSDKDKTINTPRPSTTPRSEKETPINTPKPPKTPRSEKEKTINSPKPPTTPRSEKDKFDNSPTPRRHSPFNFNDSPRKIDSSASIDAGDGGFFTDVVRRKVLTSPAPPPIIERQPSNEWKQLITNRSSIEQNSVIPNLRSLRKNSIESLTRPPPKRSTNIEETRNQIDDQSRPGSSLSSASLPVSITSSKPDFITRPSIERHPKSIQKPSTQTTTTTKKFRVEFSKKSPPPPVPQPTTIPSMVIEGKKVTSAKNSIRDSNEHLQQSINSTRSKISSGVQKSQNLFKTSSTSSMTSITRDDNILKDESITITDIPMNKSIHRHSTNIDREPTKSRKMEFSVKDGLKWNHASSETIPSKAISSSGVRRSSKVNTPRPTTPSNPTNSKLAQQFSTYDNDDGRSSRACQDVNDEECFNQLREELCSELGMASPGWDASLSEHVLKNLRGTTELPFTEKELQNNLTMLELKLREHESMQRSQTDDDISVYEEIRNL